jgi:protein gp37
MRMFTCSLSDFFHAKADKWRDEAWGIIRRTPNCVYLILTKRPERILSHLPKDWGEGYRNVRLGTSIGDRKSVYQANVLRKIPAAVRFLSCEPLLEDIADNLDISGIQWVIAGGECGDAPEYKWNSATMDWREMDSTAGRRTMDLSWAYKLYMMANNRGVPFFFKQVTSARSGEGADRLTGKEIHEFPAPPSGGVWWTPPPDEPSDPTDLGGGGMVQIRGRKPHAELLLAEAKKLVESVGIGATVQGDGQIRRTGGQRQVLGILRADSEKGKRKMKHDLVALKEMLKAGGPRQGNQAPVGVSIRDQVIDQQQGAVEYLRRRVVRLA